MKKIVIIVLVILLLGGMFLTPFFSKKDNAEPAKFTFAENLATSWNAIIPIQYAVDLDVVKKVEVFYQDSLIHTTSKALTDVGDKISADEKAQLEKAIEELKEALKGTDKESIEAKLKEFTELSGKMSDRLFAQPNAEAGDAGSQTDTAQDGAKDNKDDVVDAVFEEVKDKDKDKKDNDKDKE